ncbi:MAG: Ppx/GppA phosphatase family protein [Propionibacteriaceae bacterium]|nr:Ppx/GppA phosphatase family protein [Propionibacteriaceae bacterium]
MTTVAAIDCGTNSIRLLILSADGNGVAELAREVRLARLGQGVDATGEFHPDALRRAFAVCEEYAGLIDELGVDRTRFVATSAARDVRNRQVFLDGVRQRLGVEVAVISGDEEARLSSAGVLSGIAAPAPALIFDIGGGSTELILVGDDTRVRRAVSLNVGAVRVRERFLHDDPPTPGQVAAARRFAGELLEGAGIDFAEVVTAVGVAGTVTSAAARVLGLAEYARAAIHGTVLSREQVAETAQHWLTSPVAAIEQEPCMHPLRAGVIGGGALILDEISARTSAGAILVSETDILDGIALEMLE